MWVEIRAFRVVPRRWFVHSYPRVGGDICLHRHAVKSFSPGPFVNGAYARVLAALSPSSLSEPENHKFITRTAGTYAVLFQYEYYIVLYYIVLYYITLYYITLYYITLYYITLYYITLYCIMLCCVVLYYIILYYIILYYIILYSFSNVLMRIFPRR